MGRGSYHIIPEGEKHCVWMDAGLVNYKLCEKDFDCDSCPFDAVLKTQDRALERRPMEAEHSPARPDSPPHILGEIICQLLEPLRNSLFPNDRLYFSNHLWLKRMSDGQCRIGIDGCISHLLRPLMGAVLTNPPATIQKNSPFAWLLRENDTLSLHSAVAGAVTEVNTVLAARPSMLTTDPYGEGWIVKFLPATNQPELSGAYSPEAFRRYVPDVIARIEAFMTANLRKPRNDIGPSLLDGGRRIETIEQFMGKKRYSQLLSALLRPRPH